MKTMICSVCGYVCPNKGHMTIMEMIEQGMIFQLVIVGILFILMGVMINAVGNAKSASIKNVTVGNADSGAVTAAITAAVNEYRKNN